MIGQSISHYKIIEKLGEGGMGVVYKAEDTKLKRTVALKFLPPHLAASGQDKARFIQEAQAASALNHPNVCTIHDILEDDGKMFIVMEFVDGQTLREKKGTLSFKQAIDIGIQIADGLAAAHEKGIVHRDIKPDNIMIRKDGIVQIMDFGLAKLRASGSKITQLTKEGSTVGTAGYMSPEQVQGQETDHRSDIFSFGVLFYELITGQLPFKGVHETALMYEIVNVDAAPMSSIKPDINQNLDGIVLECLEKDPRERTQSVAQVSLDLKRFKRESTRSLATRTIATRQYTTTTNLETAEPPNHARSPMKRFFFPALTVLLAIAIVLMAWMMWKSRPESNRSVMRFSIDLPANAPMAGGTSPLDISPDGKYLVYVSQLTNLTQLYLRRMDQLDATPITGTEGASYPCFSPDGQWIAFQVGDKLKKISVFGGAPEDICVTSGTIRGDWWGPGNEIFYGHLNKGIMRVSAQGGNPELVSFLDSAGGEISHRFPQVLPDGKTIIYTIKLNSIATFDEALIAAERIGTKEKKILVRGGSNARYLPTGHLIYLRGGSFFAVAFDAEKLEVQGPPIQMFDGGWLNPFSGDGTFAFTNSGVFVYVPLVSSSFDVNTIAWMDRQGKLTTVLEKARPFFNGTISPDNQKLVLTINAANDDIWVYHLVRGTLTRLTFGGGNHGFPIWSPDGKFVVYMAEKGSSSNLFRKPWDGSGADERLTESDQQQVPTSFTNDGKHLAFSQSGDIWILPLENERKPWAFVNSPADEPYGVFSPDGNLMAYQSNESGKYEVFVVSFPKREGKWQVSSGGGIGPLWSRNGEELFYVNGTSLMSVDVSLKPTFDFSTPKKLCEIPSSTLGPWDVSSDGKRFMMVVAPAQQTTTTKVNIVLEWFDELKENLSGRKNK
ncbi:MAG: serine/threonine-protein kinase [Ignavibacteriales bacterium]|nr:serine/threonine-protein kinase [Ignavibacteriales bacterium]